MDAKTKEGEEAAARRGIHVVRQGKAKAAGADGMQIGWTEWTYKTEWAGGGGGGGGERDGR